MHILTQLCILVYGIHAMSALSLGWDLNPGTQYCTDYFESYIMFKFWTKVTKFTFNRINSYSVVWKDLLDLVYL